MNAHYRVDNSNAHVYCQIQQSLLKIILLIDERRLPIKARNVLCDGCPQKTMMLENFLREFYFLILNSTVRNKSE